MSPVCRSLWDRRLANVVLGLLSLAAVARAEFRLPVSMLGAPPERLLELAGQAPLETPTLGDLAGLIDLADVIDGKASESGHDAEMKSAAEKLRASARRAAASADLKTVGEWVMGERGFGGLGQVSEVYEDLYCHRWIVAEVDNILKEPKPALAFEPVGPDASSEIDAFEGADAAAKVEYSRAVGPYALFTRAAARALPGLKDPKPKVLNLDHASGLSTGDRENVLETLIAKRLQSVRDPFCGTGEFRLEAKRSTVLFMSLLRERRIAEAIGASFRVPDAPDWLVERNRAGDDWRIDLLRYCGLDWEDCLLAAGHTRFLARHGSEKAARKMLQALANGNFRHYLQFEYCIAEFLVPSGAVDATDPRTKLPADLEQDLLAQIIRWTGPDQPYADVKSAIDDLARLKRPEGKATFFALLKHPSSAVANYARGALVRMGESVPVIPPKPPLGFLLTFGGRPIPYRTVQWSGGAASSTVETDKNGIARFQRDELLDPRQKMDELTLIVFPQQNQLAPWMEQRVKISPDLADVTNVEFPGCTLPITIGASRDLDTRRCGAASIRVSRLDPNNKPFPDETSGLLTWQSKVPFRLPVQWKLPGISPGRYQLVVDVSGCARWDSGPIEVQPRMQPVIARLVQGSGVEVRKDQPFMYDSPALFRGEEEVTKNYLIASAQHPEAETAYFAGLPIGKYRLRVPFVEPTNKALPARTFNEQLLNPMRKVYQTIEFQVEQSSPPLLKFEATTPENELGNATVP